MPTEPFPYKGPDDPEPAEENARGDDWDADAHLDAVIGAADAGQYEMVPEWSTEDLPAGFAPGGTTDTMGPGPVLAALVHAAVGGDGAALASLPDDELLSVIRAARRMESRAVWTAMAAVREFAARRPDGSKPDSLTGFREFAADELGWELRMTWQAAAGQMAYACLVAERLPRTFAALAAGLLHPYHVRIIEEETAILPPEDAARADEVLAEIAQSTTFGQLRYKAHRLVLKLDPDSARRRKEAAKQDAHVRRFQEASGNAGMVARELPPDEVLASWQHVEQRALDLRAAGVPGTLQELRVLAYLDLLQERDSRNARIVPVADGADSQQGKEGGPHNGDSDPDGNGGPDGPGGSGGTGGPGGSGGTGGSGPGPRGRGLASTGPDGHARQAAPDRGPSIAAQVNITVPIDTVLGRSELPGEAAGFGLLDAESARDLVSAAARHPDTRWCLTVLHPDGTAAAHGCAAGRRPWPLGYRPQRDDEPPGLLKPPGSPDPPDLQPAEFIRTLNLTLHPVIRGPCNHAQAEHGYRPSRKLQHLINARNARCSAPGCGRPAARCDLDHSTAWHLGGLTCPCNLAPKCQR